MRLQHYFVVPLLLTAVVLSVYPMVSASAAPHVQAVCPDDVSWSFAPTPFLDDGVVELRLTNSTTESALLTDFEITWAPWYDRFSDVLGPRLESVYVGGTSINNADLLWYTTAISGLPLPRDNEGNRRPVTKDDGIWWGGVGYVIPPESEVSIWLDFSGSRSLDDGPWYQALTSDFADTRFILTCDYDFIPTGTDVNRDTFVTPADTVYVVNRLGSDDLTADVNGDGTVNIVDVDLVLAQLGEQLVTPTRLPTTTPTPTATARPPSFDCSLVTLAEADFDENLSEDERKIGFGIYEIVFRIRNDNNTDAILQDVNLHWGAAAYWAGTEDDPIPRYPNAYFEKFLLNGVTFWTGTDALPDTDTANPNDGDTVDGRVFRISRGTSFFVAAVGDGPQFLFETLDRSDFNGTEFTIVNPLTNQPCPEPLTFNVGP